jgi:ABC-type transport system involved in multi-copper enzyme maturation permease subunit
VGRLIGLAGLVVLLVAAARSIYPPVASWLRGGGAGGPQDYLVGGGGLLLMVLGFLYVAVSVGLCSDRPFVVMTRRELGAFFYSPIAYFVLIAFVLAAGINFVSFISGIAQFQVESGRGMAEPIVRNYFVSLWPVISVLIAVPVLTMRLLSEEQRAGTLEVMLTAPVEETTLVLSKFTAALLMFLTVCIPFGLMLVALRLVGDKPFDARPLLAFFVGLVITGAGFVAMGLFFSALTRNQVAAAVLTFVGMLALLFVYIFKFILPPTVSTIWNPVLTHISFLDVWVTTLEGKILPNLLLFHISLAVVCLFLTVKWLESRKWR